MENGEKERLDKIEHLAEDNNRMLKKLYHAMQWGRAVRILYVVLVLSIMFGLYYYIQPYVGDFVDIYLGAQNALDMLKNAPQ